MKLIKKSILTLIILFPLSSYSSFDLGLGGCLFCSPKDFYIPPSKLMLNMQKNELLIGIGGGTNLNASVAYAFTDNIIISQMTQSQFEIFSSNISYLNSTRITLKNEKNNIYYGGDLAYNFGQFSDINAKVLSGAFNIGFIEDYFEVYYSISLNTLKLNRKQIENYYNEWEDVNNIEAGTNTHLFTNHYITLSTKYKGFKLSFQQSFANQIDYAKFYYLPSSTVGFLSYQIRINSKNKESNSNKVNL
jgi:hypothetical protein